MKKYIPYVLFALLSLTAGSLWASLDKEGAKKITETALQLIMDEKIPDAYLLLAPHWPIPHYEVELTASKTQRQIEKTQERYGKAVGIEYLGEEKLGKSFVKYQYLLKFINHAIYWEFIFYRANDVWQINAVAMTDKLNPFFE